MREPIEIIMHRGHMIEIFYDENVHENPNDWDPESIALFHDHRDFAAYPVIKKQRLGPEFGMDMFNVFHKEDVYEFAGITFWIFAVYAYIHGGVSLYSNRRDATQFEPTGFDTSFRGFCLVSQDIYPEKDAAFDAMQSTLKTWNEYLSGEIYGYQIDGEGGCWGFYGDEGKKQLIEEAKGEIEFDHPTWKEYIIRVWKNYLH